MEKVYKYNNGIICVRNLDRINQQILHNATEKFLKKVIEEKKESYIHGNRSKSRTSRN